MQNCKTSENATITCIKVSNYRCKNKKSHNTSLKDLFIDFGQIVKFLMRFPDITQIIWSKNIFVCRKTLNLCHFSRILTITFVL